MSAKPAKRFTLGSLVEGVATTYTALPVFKTLRAVLAYHSTRTAVSALDVIILETPAVANGIWWGTTVTYLSALDGAPLDAPAVALAA